MCCEVNKFHNLNSSIWEKGITKFPNQRLLYIGDQLEFG